MNFKPTKPRLCLIFFCAYPLQKHVFDGLFQKKTHCYAMGLVGLVGMTGFEPATTRPPDVYATGLRYIPSAAKIHFSDAFQKEYEWLNVT